MPMQVMTAALKTGITRVAAIPAGNRRNTCEADTTMIPMAISTDARPALKAVINANPYTARCRAMALSKTTSADGHGTIPPEIPSATIDLAVIGPSGT